MSRRNKKNRNKHQRQQMIQQKNNSAQVPARKKITSITQLQEIINLRADVYDDLGNKIPFVRLMHCTLLGFMQMAQKKSFTYTTEKQIIATESNERTVDREYALELDSFDKLLLGENS